MILTNEKCDALLKALDDIARKQCQYEYGLPVDAVYSEPDGSGSLDMMRKAIREWATPSEADQIIDLCVKR